MSKFKEFKQKVKDNKYKIIAGTITIAGIVYVIVNQNGKIKQLQETNQEQQSDIDLLKHIMDGTVLASLKESLTRKLRYAEGRLANGLKDGVMTAEDEKLRREEIEYFSNELAKIFKAEEMLDRSNKG